MNNERLIVYILVGALAYVLLIQTCGLVDKVNEMRINRNNLIENLEQH